MNILITGAWPSAKENIKKLEDMGFSVCFLQDEKGSLPCDYDIPETVICNGLFLHHDIARFSNLKNIILTSAGCDRIPLAYARENGIKVYNAVGVYSIPIAESVICGVLDFIRKSYDFYAQKKTSEWKKIRDLGELCGKKVCIVGCGNVGSECAKRFSAFGCEVYGVDKITSEKPFFSEIYDVSELPKALSGADVTVLTLPLTEETYHLFDRNIFDSMKKGTIFVNVSRGKIADSEALKYALDNIISGAVLDVFETEPLPEESFLWNYDNVIVTPHNAFIGEGNEKRLNHYIFNILNTI